VRPTRLFGGIRLLDRPSPANVLRLDTLSLPLLVRMHQNGIWLNPSTLASLSQEAAGEMSRLEGEIRRHIPDRSLALSFNPGSPDQIARLLFDVLKLEPATAAKPTPTGKRLTVDDEVLSQMAPDHPVIECLRDWRELAKLKGTYIDTLAGYCGPDGRLRTTFRDTVARTGRLSSEDPNLQNIPIRSKLGARIRSAFQVDPRYRGKTILGSLDLSQIEMVMAAQLSGDAAMQNVFRRGEDIHIQTVAGVWGYDPRALARDWAIYKALPGGQATPAAAAALWADLAELQELASRMRQVELYQRLPMKQVGFGILYGQTPAGVQASVLSIGGPLLTEEDCARYIQNWFTVYPAVSAWLELQYQRARRYGMVWDLFGRPRLIPGVRSALRGVVNEALRQCGNTPIQGSAAGVLKLGMAEIEPLVASYQGNADLVCLPLLQIHDELIFELSREIAPEFLEIACGLLETCCPLDVPVRASLSTGENWQQLK